MPRNNLTNPDRSTTDQIFAPHQIFQKFWEYVFAVEVYEHIKEHHLGCVM